MAPHEDPSTEPSDLGGYSSAQVAAELELPDAVITELLRVAEEGTAHLKVLTV